MLCGVVNGGTQTFFNAKTCSSQTLKSTKYSSEILI